MASKTTAETAPYKTPGKPGVGTEAAMNSQKIGGGQKASYTPNSNINEHSYGKDGGKANAQSGDIPSVEANGSVVGALPAIPAVLKIGEDKNVSTPVSGG